MPPPYFFSRSSLETAQACKRRWFYSQVYGGIGISSVYRNVPLVTGGALHVGVGTLMSYLKEDLSISDRTVTFAVDCAEQEYQHVCEEREFTKVPREDQEFTYNEQLALTGQLVRLWAAREMPIIQAEYNVLAVEEDIKFCLDPVLDIWFLSKTDALLERKHDGDMLIYSLKSTKGGDARVDESYTIDLQGITESLAHTISSKENLKVRKVKGEKLKKWWELNKGKPGAEAKARDFIAKLPPRRNPKIMGIRYCMLVKGTRIPPKGEGWDSQSRYTNSPLLIGHRSDTPYGFEYAWSNKIPRPENQSGWGYLGKGWQEFNVWETDSGPARAIGGPKGWFEMLKGGEVQPELGNPLEKLCYSPVERTPTQHDYDTTLIQIISEARDLTNRRISYEKGELLDRCFPQTRRACDWPTRCEFYTACWKSHPDRNLLDSGFYEERKPHHEIEADSREERG